MMLSSLVDFHCHLDLYANHAAAVQRCEEKGIHTVAVTTTPKAWYRNKQLADGTKYVYAALGLHPQLVAERAEEIDLWKALLPQARYVGEVGLDASPRFYRSLELQKVIFSEVLTACAASGNKVLSIHSVRTSKLILDMIKMHMPPPMGSAILHWFTGTKADAKRATELGCSFSINSEMFRSADHVALIRTLPLSQILTETDGPFTKVGNRPSEPSDVRYTIEKLAAVFGLTYDQMANEIIENFDNIICAR